MELPKCLVVLGVHGLQDPPEIIHSFTFLRNNKVAWIKQILGRAMDIFIKEIKIIGWMTTLQDGIPRGMR
jgi:hypothetical protein